MIYAEEFWGEQGRVGTITAGEWADSLLFMYPEYGIEGWWTLNVSPSPFPGVPGDMYLNDEKMLIDDLTRWEVKWMPLGNKESEIERREFQIRPLLTKEELKRLPPAEVVRSRWSNLWRLITRKEPE